MMRRAILAAVLTVFCGRAVAGDVDEEKRVWRHLAMCPINTLYVLAKVKNIPLSYHEIEMGLPGDFRGSNIKDMRDLANSKGMEMQVVKADPSYLKTCPLPAIAHYELDDKDSGHYVVVMATNGDQVEIIDGTTAAIETLTMADFSKLWTGYLLISRKAEPWPYVIPLVSGLAAVGIVGSHWYVVRKGLTSEVST